MRTQKAEIQKLEKIVNIINNIEGLTGKFDSIKKQIAKNEKRADNKLDSFFINYPEEQELELTRGSIHSYLQDAINLNLHKEERVVEYSSPGKYINVPQYITAMCNRHDISFND